MRSHPHYHSHCSHGGSTGRTSRRAEMPWRISRTRSPRRHRSRCRRPCRGATWGEFHRPRGGRAEEATWGSDMLLLWPNPYLQLNSEAPPSHLASTLLIRDWTLETLSNTRQSWQRFKIYSIYKERNPTISSSFHTLPTKKKKLNSN